MNDDELDRLRKSVVKALAAARTRAEARAAFQAAQPSDVDRIVQAIREGFAQVVQAIRTAQHMNPGQR